MRFFVVATRDRGLEDCTPEFLASEAEAAAKLWAEDSIREIYNRTDGMGGIVVVEAKDEKACRVIDDVAAGSSL